MTSNDAHELLGRLRRLDQLITAYGHILIASELERPLPAVIPLLTSDDLSDAEAGGLVKEILRRSGAALVADLEEVERLVRQAKKEPEIATELRGVRLAFRQTARLQAGALARKMGRVAQGGAAAGPEAASLQKELQAFIGGVARAVREDDEEFEEVFAGEDLLTDAEEPVIADGETAPQPGEAPPDPPRSFLYKKEYKEEPEKAESIWERNGSGPEAATDEGEDPSDPATVEHEDGSTAAAEEERPLDWLRDRVDVYNEMLARWGAGETFVPESAALVRREILTPARCGELYRDLLTAGPQRLVDRAEELGAIPGGGDDRLRYLRARIADGLATGVPRILALLVSGEALPADLDDASRGGRGALADLSAYLVRAVDLFDEASPLHSRLGYLASELRSAVRLTSA